MALNSKEGTLMAKKTGTDKPFDARANMGLGGILGGLGNLVEKLAEVAERAEEISKSGEIQGRGKGITGVYGFTVKTGLGGEQGVTGVKVEPFGTIHREKAAGHSPVVEIREPLADIFEEDDHVTIVAEMPGIGVEDLRLELKDDILTLAAEKGDKKYSKEILLPGTFSREKMAIACNNGVVEIKCTK
jgi:HSP20 family protein